MEAVEDLRGREEGDDREARVDYEEAYVPVLKQKYQYMCVVLDEGGELASVFPVGDAHALFDDLISGDADEGGLQIGRGPFLLRRLLKAVELLAAPHCALLRDRVFRSLDSPTVYQYHVAVDDKEHDEHDNADGHVEEAESLGKGWRTKMKTQSRR